MRLLLLLSIAAVAAASDYERGGDAWPPVRAAGKKGPVVAIGGGADQPDVVKRFIALAGGEGARILVVPVSTGAEKPGEAMAAYFKEQGARDVAIWNPADAAAADLPESLAALRGAKGLYFGGGDQTRGMTKLKGARALAEIRRLHAEGAVVGGSSAGAAILSLVMMNGGEIEGPLAKGRSSTQEGLGVVDDYVIDQHFLARSRFERLINVLLDRPGTRGLGIDERTAAIFTGDKIEIVGRGQAVVVEPPSDVRERYVDGRPLAAVGAARFRVLCPGDVVAR